MAAPTMEVEQEIREICRASIRGHYVDTRRIVKLSRKYPVDWKWIHDEEREIAISELNPLYNPRNK
jgi:hypothetical protein